MLSAGEANYEAMFYEQISAQLTELKSAFEKAAEDREETRGEMGALRAELTKTATIIRDYNGLREKIQQHDQALSKMGAFQEGYKEAQNANTASQEKHSRRIGLAQNWGSLVISLSSLIIAGIAMLHK